MSSLRLSFFGSPQVERDGERIKLDTRKALALLVYIAMNKRAHSREKLAALFWPESPEEKALTNLRQTVWVLKKHLSDNWLNIRRHAIEIKQTSLETSSLWIDIEMFHRHLEHVTDHEHSPATACARCLPSLIAAIDLYTDDFLRGFTLSDCPDFDDWQFFQTDILREKLVESLKKVVRYEASQHNLPRAIHYARLWLARDPWEEAAHRELMRLYVLNQQRTAALQQYEECARILKQEFDAGPEQQTRDLYEAILNQQTPFFISTPEKVSKTVQVAISSGADAQKLYHPTPFIGRQQELKAIIHLLHQPACRLLTLLGFGGIGKTRLAQKITRDMLPSYPDGVYFFSLAEVPSPDLLLPAFADALHFSPSPKQDHREAFFQYLANRQLLLILDNFEHLIAGKELLINMLSHAPDIQLLVTSRERLHIREEWVYEVASLSYPSEEQADDIGIYDAVQLFEQAARRRHPEFTITSENALHIIRLCQLVDGMPLALELAASWCNMLACHQIVEEIERSFDFLSSRDSAPEPRHQSVRVVFESLWKRLTSRQQKQICTLSLFQGSFDAHTAHTIAGTSLPHLAGLVDRSLLQCEADGRFAIHPLLQRFLRENLEEDSQECTSAANAFCHFYGEFVSQQERRLKTGRQQDALHTFSIELPNILQAWQWALARQQFDTLQVMIPGLALFYEMQSRFQEGRAIFQKAIAHLSHTPELSHPIVAPQLMVQQAVFTKYLVHGQDVTSLYQHVLPLLDMHNELELALTFIQIGWVKSWHSLELDEAELYEAEQWIARGKQLAETKGDTWEIARALFALGDLVFWGKVAHEEAEDFYQSSLELRQHIGDQWGQAAAFNALGQIAHRSGLYRKARWLHREALGICQAFHDSYGIALAKGRLADIATDMGEYHEAWTLSREAYHLAQRFGNQVIPAWRLLNLGTISFEQGDYDEALRYAQQSHMMFQQIQHRWGPGAAILQIGQILLEQGYLDEAERTFRKGLAIFQASHDIFGETSALFQLGKAHYASGDQTAACERMLTSLNMAHERQYLLNLLRFLGEFGRMLAETISSPSAIEVLSYVAHSPATPYHAKKQAQVVLTRQKRQYDPQHFQAAIDAGKRANVNDIMEKLTKTCFKESFR